MGSAFSSKKAPEESSSSSFGMTTTTTGSNNNHNHHQKKTASPTSVLVIAWNALAAGTVLLPLLLFGIAKLFSRRGGEGGGGEGEGGWWNFWDGPEEERFSGIGQGFVYLWSLTLFGFLIWRGHKVLERSDANSNNHNHNSNDIRVLFVALLFFANLAFLCWILLATTGGDRREGGGGGEDSMWIGQFSSVMTLTFFFWTAFAVGFVGIFYARVRRSTASSSSSSSSSYSLWGGGESRKNDNDSGLFI